jgi:hypothetical protein
MMNGYLWDNFLIPCGIPAAVPVGCLSDTGLQCLLLFDSCVVSLGGLGGSTIVVLIFLAPWRLGG